jgi:hypothetical protein
MLTKKVHRVTSNELAVCGILFQDASNLAKIGVGEKDNGRGHPRTDVMLIDDSADPLTGFADGAGRRRDCVSHAGIVSRADAVSILKTLRRLPSIRVAPHDVLWVAGPAVNRPIRFPNRAGLHHLEAMLHARGEVVIFARADPDDIPAVLAA